MDIQYDGQIAVNTATLDRPTNFMGLSPTLQRPTLVLNRNWQPIYAHRMGRIQSWNKFISEA